MVSAAAAILAIWLCMFLVGPDVEAGGVIHALCVGAIAVFLFYIINGIRTGKERSPDPEKTNSRKGAQDAKVLDK